MACTSRAQEERPATPRVSWTGCTDRGVLSPLLDGWGCLRHSATFMQAVRESLITNSYRHRPCAAVLVTDVQV